MKAIIVKVEDVIYYAFMACCNLQGLTMQGVLEKFILVEVEGHLKQVKSFKKGDMEKK